MRWLRQGNDVDVVSTRDDTVASSLQLKHQMERTLAADPPPPQAPGQGPGQVRLHLYDFDRNESDVEKAIRDLSGPTRHVLMDEVDFDSRYVQPCGMCLRLLMPPSVCLSV